MSREWIGFLAAILTTGAYIPQVIKIWKTKTADGVSLSMYWVMLTGVSLWGIYGILIESYPIILANVITLILLVTIIIFKLKHK